MGRINFEQVFTDGQGRVVQDGSITVYKAGTNKTVLATIYSTETIATSIAGSVVKTDPAPNGTGVFNFWMDDYTEEIVDVVLSRSDLIQTNYDNTPIIHKEIYQYYANAGETDQGITGNGNTILAFINTIGSNSQTIVLKPGTYTLATNLTIPANVTLKILNGAKIAKSGTATLTINGYLEAGLWQVFSGFAAGNVTFDKGYLKEAVPQWWGAKGDGTTDDTLAIQSAFKICPAGTAGRTIFFPTGTYKITSPINIDNTISWVYGGGPYNTQINAIGCTAFTMLTQPAYNLLIEKMYVLGDLGVGLSAFDTTPSGVTIAAKVRWSDLKVYGFDRLFNVPNLQLGVFEDIVANCVSGGSVFYVHPAADGLNSNSNRIERMQVTGANCQLYDMALTAARRATEWSIRDSDIQISGTTIPITIQDVDYTVENCEFENSTANNLVKVTANDIVSGSYARIMNNIFTGGGAGGNGLIRLESTGAQHPTSVLIMGNDGGSGVMIDIATACIGTTIINNTGTVNNTLGRLVSILQNGVLNVQNGAGGNDAVGLATGSISGTTTLGKNLRGTVLFAGAGTKAVTFAGARPEPDASYYVAVSGDVNETFFVTNKLTTGFTINSSNAGSTANVDWHLIR